MSNTKIFNIYTTAFFVSRLPLNIQDVKSDIMKLPPFLFTEVNKVYIYNSSDLDNYDLDSSYGNRVVKIDSSKIETRKDLMKTLIHELYHSIQKSIKETFREQFEKVSLEYLTKKKHILDIFRNDSRFTAPKEEYYTEIFYTEEFDHYLYKVLTYRVLNNRLKDYFPSAYSITSVDEYMAVCFEIFFFENPKWLSMYCPEVFELIKTIGSYEKQN